MSLRIKHANKQNIFGSRLLNVSGVFIQDSFYRLSIFAKCSALLLQAPGKQSFFTLEKKNPYKEFKTLSNNHDGAFPGNS